MPGRAPLAEIIRLVITAQVLMRAKLFNLVIPAQSGIQSLTAAKPHFYFVRPAAASFGLDSRLRGNDKLKGNRAQRRRWRLGALRCSQNPGPARLAARSKNARPCSGFRSASRRITRGRPGRSACLFQLVAVGHPMIVILAWENVRWVPLASILSSLRR
jgi:hypothetical protein